ncbi:calcium-binding protein, partial [Rheinheimera pleomorphica]|uniref:calcium-binding protein n=3 Tax=Rheinheimera pleomorphica TaxID=2703963 RepID=UPI002B250EA8
NDRLHGGTGNDSLNGGAGSDEYHFARGWGQDNINNYDTGSDKTDAIVFAEGIAPADIQVTRSGDSLVLSLLGTNDRITVSNYFHSDGTSAYKLEEIRFADGTVWNVAQIKVMVMQSTNANDILYGYATDDVLHGGAGNDTLHGQAGNDRLHGGTGNDSLNGGAGSDEYHFARGWGQDNINNYDTGSDKTDAIVFAEGIAPADIQLTRSGNSLVLSLLGSTDRITVSSYFDSDANGVYKLEEIRFADGTVWNIAQVKELAMQSTVGNDSLYGYATDDVLHGGEGNDTLFGQAGDDELHGEAGDDRQYGGEGQDVLFGGEGNDQLYGDADNDRLYGGAGNDTLQGGAGADVLDGGEGNDSLNGGTGSDAYHFARGWGQDTINNYDTGTDKADAIVFAEGIAPADIQVTRSGDSLVLSLLGTNDRITVSNYFHSDGTSAYKLEEIRFADGTVWNIAQVKEFAMQSSDGDDSLYGYATDDVLHGGEGNDTLYGQAGDDELHGDAGDDRLYGGEGQDVLYGSEGNDQLYGDAGNDRLYGGAGNDTLQGSVGADVLDGGEGNDQLSGGAGNDTYLFGRGDGQDTIHNHDAVDHNNTLSHDRLVFKDGVVLEDVEYYRSGANLVFRIAGSTDSITVNNWFSSAGSYKLQSVEFADGRSLDLAQVEQDVRTIHGDASNNNIAGFETDDVLYGHEGNDSLFGKDGDDKLYGGAGNDVLEGNAGSDEYHFARGWGQDAINNYDTGSDKTDAIVFAQGIVATDIQVTRQGDHLLLSLVDSTDHITVKDYFNNDGSSSYKLEEVRFADGVVWSIEQVKAFAIQATDSSDDLLGYATDDVIRGGGGNDSIYGRDGDDKLYGDAGDDSLNGGLGNDKLYGGDGDDYLSGDVGNDRLEGGAGNDRLSGGAGSDEYHFARGWGQDTIDNFDSDSNKTDAIVFAEGISASDIRVAREDDDLLLTLANSTDSIKVNGYFLDGSSIYLLEEVRFADGTVWDAEQVKTILQQGTSGNDVLYGLQGDDVIHAGAGDDAIYAVEGNNELYGEDGNDTITGTGLLDGGAGDDVLEGKGADTLRGGDGNDTLIAHSDAWMQNQSTLEGGKGNDTLYGGFGDDTYIFNLGDGADVIIERRQGEAYSNVEASNDTLQFGEGIAADDLLFIRSGSDLLIRHSNGTDSITVQNWFAGSAHYQLNLLTFTDGSELTAEQIESQLVTFGTEGDDSLFGSAQVDVIYGEAGDDYIDGRAGDDKLYGGAGSDTIVGGAGNDLLVGGTGDDKYVYNPQTGQDTIDNTGGGFDGVFFTNGIDASRLSFSQDGDDLLILVDGDETQSVRVLNHFLGGDAAISYVQPSGGYMLTAEQIATAIAAGGEEPVDPTDPVEPVDPVDPVDPTEPTEPVEPGQGGSITPGLGGNDSLTGTTANDVLLGGAGDDVLTGLAGNDRLFGGTGSDTYIYHAGQDLITELGGTDKLIFSNGITFNQVASGLTKSGNDLILKVNGSNDNSVTLSNFFLGGAHLVENFEFETGGSISAAQIFGAFGLAVPTADAPVVNAVQGTAGNDTLNGSAAADILSGSHGNDRLNGGTGNDQLSGGRGNDTYVFSAGSGHDTIDNSGGGEDVLLFEGISFNQVASGLMKSGNDLVLNIGGGSDKVTLKNWFLGGDYVVPTIRFAAGGEISANQIFGAFGLTNPNPQGSLAYTDLPDERAFGNVFVGTGETENIVGSSDDDFIDAGNGNDILNGGAGNDYLLGGRGNDTYLFGANDGYNTINNYDPTTGRTDVLRFAQGINPGDVAVQRDGDNLLLVVADTSVAVVNYFAEAGASAYRLDQIQFADGSIWAMSEINSQLMSGVSVAASDLDRNYAGLVDALNAFDADSEAELGSFIPAAMSAEQYTHY